jgi:unconventional prefoldin RPB5 interactor 1
MTAAVRDSFKDLERHRLRLEENVEKLRKSLQHWRVWDAEYEGFKEEILGLKSQPTNAELVSTSRADSWCLKNWRNSGLTV